MCGRGLCDIITLSVLQRGVHPGGGAQEGHRCPGGWVPGAREEQPDSPPGVAPPARTCLLLMTSHPVMCESEQQLPHSGVGELWTLKRFRERVWLWWELLMTDKPDVVFVYQKHLNLILRFSSCSGNKLIFFKTKRLTKRKWNKRSKLNIETGHVWAELFISLNSAAVHSGSWLWIFFLCGYFVVVVVQPSVHFNQI